MSHKVAINRAVDECIEEGILSDILEAHKAEVQKMIFTTNQEKRFLRHFREEVREETAAEYIAIINEKDSIIADKDAIIADKDALIADKDSIIAKLQEELAAK